jgi:hypothetical protein
MHEGKEIEIRFDKLSSIIYSNEITKNSKNSFFKLGKKYYTKTSIILTVLINGCRISLKSTGFSDYSLLKHRILITLYDGKKRMCTTTLIFRTLYLSNFCSKKFILNLRFA